MTKEHVDLLIKVLAGDDAQRWLEQAIALAPVDDERTTKLEETVQEIISQVRMHGDQAVASFATRFGDKAPLSVPCWPALSRYCQTASSPITWCRSCLRA